MDLSNQIILLGGLLCLVSILASVLTARLGMPLLLVFLVLGMLAGEDGPGGISFHDVQAAHLIGSLALAIILFNGGLCTDVGSFRVGLWPAFWLATLGVLVTAAITGLAAVWLLQLSWLEGLLIGAIVGSTDAAAVFAILHAHGLRLKQRVDASLQIESGINDPMAIFLTIALVEILVSVETAVGWDLLHHFVTQMGLGVLLGLLGGWLLAALINAIPLSLGLYPLLAFSGTLLIFGATSVIGGSGFLAVYLVGLILGNRPLQSIQNIRRFHDGMAWLSQIGMFLILGLLVYPSELLPIAGAALLLAAVLMLVARPFAVLTCLVPFRFDWREQLFISWVGLRGAVPIVLALFPMLAGLDNAELFFNVAFFVVLVSLIVQGWTVAPMARLLRLELPPSPGAVHRVELDLPGKTGYEFIGYRLATDSPVLNRALPDLPLPENTKPAAVLRQGRLLDSSTVKALSANDEVYLIAHADDLILLDRLFVATHAPPELVEQRFFGGIVLNGDATMSEIALFYGLPLPPEAKDLTLEQFFSRQFGKPVVGDRVELGRLEFVIREMHDRRVTRVGIKPSRRLGGNASILRRWRQRWLRLRGK